MFWKKLKYYKRSVNYKYCCVFYKIILLNYVRAINLVRLSIKYKYKTIKLQKNKQTTYILNILANINAVFGWVNSADNNNYLVFTNPNFTKNIHIFIKPSRQLFIKKKHYNAFLSKSTGSSIFISTSNGVITLDEASKKKCGGVLLFRLV